MVITTAPDNRFYEHQDDIVLNQNAPGSGVEYAVLPATTNVKIISMMGIVTWTVQPNPLELHLILDTVPIEFPRANPVTAAPQFAVLRGDIADGRLAEYNGEPDPLNYRSHLIEGKSAEYTAETTGGTVSNLSSRCTYQRYI